MAEVNRRKSLLNTNKYQRRIIALAFTPSFLLCVYVFIILTLFIRELTDVILYGSEVSVIQMITQWGGFIALSLWIVFILILIWSYVISRNLVGAFVRILRELDEVIEGKDRKAIKARPKDDLANELLERVNILITRALKK